MTDDIRLKYKIGYFPNENTEILKLLRYEYYGFPFVCDVELSDELDEWCDENGIDLRVDVIDYTFPYPVYLGVQEVCFIFKSTSDATQFKLAWIG